MSNSGAKWGWPSSNTDGRLPEAVRRKTAESRYASNDRPAREQSRPVDTPPRTRGIEANVALPKGAAATVAFAAARVLLLLLLIGGGVLFATTHHVVLTAGGLRVYDRAVPGAGAMYADFTTLRGHSLSGTAPVIAAMVAAGDLALVPGGEELVRAAAVVERGMDAVEQLDRRTGVVTSAAKLGGAMTAKAAEIDAKHDVSGKTLRAAEQAAGMAAKGMDAASRWLGRP